MALARSPLLRQLAVNGSTKKFIKTSARPISASVTNNGCSKAVIRPFLRRPTFTPQTSILAQFALIHASARRDILPPLPQKLSGTANEAAPVPTPDSMHGRYHWTFERVVSAALIPVTIAPFAGAAMYPVADSLLAGLIIIHSHVGFQSVIIDYLPKGRVPKSRLFFDWVLRIGSLVVAYGFYEFETNDVGLCEGVRRVWHA